MIRLKLFIELNFEIGKAGADFVFNIHAAHTSGQIVSGETLALSQPVSPLLYTDLTTGNRYMRFHAQPGMLRLAYTAVVSLMHYRANPVHLAEVPIADLPANVIIYLYPSRFCESDRIRGLAVREFGRITPGHGRVRAIQEWIAKRTAFSVDAASLDRSAIETLIDQVGVRSDFAHLMIALCRAIHIPARLAIGTSYGVDPVFGCAGLHPYVEVYLGDHWYIFDPAGAAIPMGFVRFGLGRDAADVGFATNFGGVKSGMPLVRVSALGSKSKGIELPHHCSEALSIGFGAWPGAS